jgi:hypothetical protein
LNALEQQIMAFKEKFLRQSEKIFFNVYNNHDELSTEEQVAASASTSVLTIFNRNEQSSTSDLRNENGNFLWFQLFIEILLKMKFNRDATKTQLIKYFKVFYKHKPAEILKIEELEKEYLPENAIRWYTKDMCLYQQLNQALRSKTVDLLIILSWFISDLHKQLAEDSATQKTNSIDQPTATVYRGQLISKKEFERIQNSIGSFLSINSFLSTTEDREVARAFAGEESNRADGLVSLLIEIKTDRRVNNLKPYANIARYTLFPDEKEILFMLGTVFRIISLEFNTTYNNWILLLEICSEDDRDYQQMFEYEKRELVGDNPTYYNLAELMYRVGDYDASEKYFNRYLKMTVKPQDMVLCYAGLSKVYQRKNNTILQMEYAKKASEILESQKSIIKNANALDQLNQLIKDTILNEEESSDLHITKAQANVANKRDDLAILNYEKVSTIQKRQLPDDHPDIARTLFNMAHCYVALKQFEKGEQLMQEALEIRRKSLPGNHRDLALTYSSLGSVYVLMIKSELGLEYFLKAREIHLASDKPDAIDIWVTDTSIQRLQATGFSVTSPTLK